MANDSLLDTIRPKSDQLNYDDLIGGPITVQITGVRRGATVEQPVIIEIEGWQPYMPCKSMRRVMIAAWGDKGRAWVGRWLTLYGDPSVKFGGVAVGGIRISHMSHINEASTMMLTTTRSKRAGFTVAPLDVPAEPDKESRADKCRRFLAENGKTEKDASLKIGKILDEATAADFKAIAAWVKDTADKGAK